MDDAVADVLKTIGWDSGFRLPIANEENQALERELARLVIKKSAIAKEYDDITASSKSLQEHVKYVRQETKQNQTLLTTYNQQLESEKHKLKLKQAEMDNTVAESRRFAKASESLRSRLASKKLLLARNLAKLEKMKTEAEWDSEAMRAREESVKKRDDDNELLKKFSEEDKKKLTELETRRKNLQNEANVRKNMLAQMNVDVLNYEQVMMRSGKMLNSLKEEREALVNQWQESVKNLRQKDLDIKRAHASLEEIQDNIRQKREAVEEQEAFLSNEKNSNKYIQLAINEVNVANFRMRKEHYAAIEVNRNLLNDHISKKKIMQRTVQEMNRGQTQLKQASKLKEDYTVRISRLQQDIDTLKCQDVTISGQSEGASKNIDLIDGLIKETEKSGQILTRQMQTLLNKQYKMNSSTAELARVNHSTKAEFCALENALGQIRKQSAIASQSLIHKKQILSDLQMKVACLEAQMGNTDPDDMQDFEEMWRIKIQELEDQQKQHNEIKNLLHGQILKLQKENLRLVNSIATDSGAYQVLKDKLQSFQLQIEGGIKQTKSATLRTQQLQVEENLIKLKVDKLQNAVNNAEEEIYNMQRYKIDLESTLKERLIEVMAARDVLFAKKKNLDEDRSRLKADVSQRYLKLQQLENKYNLSLVLLGKDEVGEPMSVAAFKVHAAQEKYELQQEGDELDKKIRQAEQEIVAMENTLKVVNMTNKSFRDSLTIVDEDSQDAEELKRMQDELTLKLSALKGKRHQLYTQVDIERDLKGELEQCMEIKRATQEELDKLEATLTQYLREEENREEKIDRASKHLAACSKKIDKQNIEKYDRELYIRQVEETNKSIIHQLADFAAQYPETLPVIRTKFEKEELEMPKQRSSLGSISSDSVLSPSSNSSSSTPCYPGELKRGRSKFVVERPSAANVTCLQLDFDLPMSDPQSRASRTSLASSGSSASKNSKPKRK